MDLGPCGLRWHGILGSIGFGRPSPLQGLACLAVWPKIRGSRHARHPNYNTIFDAFALNQTWNRSYAIKLVNDRTHWDVLASHNGIVFLLKRRR